MTDARGALVVVDILGLSSLWSLLTQRRCSKHVRYAHMAKGMLARGVISALRCCGWSFAPLASTLAAVNGTSPYKELDAMMLGVIHRCHREFLAEHLRVVEGLSPYERRRLATYFGKCAAAELYLTMQLCVMLRADADQGAPVSMALIRRSPFTSLVAEVFRAKGLRLAWYRALWWQAVAVRPQYQMDRFVTRKTRSRWYRLLHMALLLGYAGWSRIVCRPMPPARSTRVHRVCALIANRYALDRYSCLSWVRADDDAMKREVLAIYGGAMPADALAFYQGRCDRLLRYSFLPMLNRQAGELRAVWASYAPGLLRSLWQYRRLVSAGRLARWLWKYLPEFLIKTAFFEALFRVHGARVLWTMNDDDVEGQLAAIAMHRVGGISLGASWSQTVLPEWDVHRNQNDIVFVWGDRMRDIAQQAQEPCHSLVTAGYPGDHHFAEARREGLALRTRLLRLPHVRTIAVFFDAMPAQDALMVPARLAALYEELFGWLEDDPGNFLVIKTKRHETLHWHTGLQARIREYSRAQRLETIHDRSTIAPGLAGDVVLGLGASLSLPSLAATLGRPTVLYDPHHILRDFPLGLPNVIAVSAVASVRPAIVTALQHRPQAGHVEPLPPFTRSAVDPFVDGRSAERSRDYVADVLRAFNARVSSAQAIATANERYRSRWGGEMISRGPLAEVMTP